CNVSLFAFSSSSGSMFQHLMGANGEPRDYDYNYTVLYDNVDINTFGESWHTAYNTNGGTPLIDASCKTIDDVKRQINNLTETQKPGRVIILIATDGEE